MLDVVFVDRYVSDYEVSVEQGFSDHVLIFDSILLPVNNVTHLSGLKTVKNYMPANDDAILNHLKTELAVICESDPLLLWSNFENICLK